MNNLIYTLKMMRTMNYGAMIKKINSIHHKTHKSRIYIFNDMRKCATKYGAGYMDYDLYEMYNLNDEQRDTYLTRGRNNELVRRYCDKSYLHYFQNKDEFNARFSEYIKRDWIKVKGNTKDSVIDFINKHNDFMAKPIDGGCGKGIEKLSLKDFSSVDELYEYLNAEGNNFELEEIIIQHPDVSKINPYSINTLRVVTLVTTKDGKSFLSVPEEERKNTEIVPHIICTYFRIGNGKRFVDNFNSGGMTAPVDTRTGIVLQSAIDKQKNLYDIHPDTGAIIKGFKFPDWDKALELCIEAAKVIPEMGYAGWDVAFTPEGPLFVEGNEFPGHDIYQLPEHTPDKIGMIPNFGFLSREDYPF